MEQIPKDYIETAEDFFSFMSKEERSKMNKSFSDEQPILYHFFNHMINIIKDKDAREVGFDLYLTIYRSFKYYEVKIPTMTIENIMGITEKTGKLLMDNCDDSSTSNEIFINLKKFMNQDELMDHIHRKMFEMKDGNAILSTPEIWLDVFYEVMNVISILNDESKKHLTKDLN